MLDTPVSIKSEHQDILNKWFEGAGQFVNLAGYNLKEGGRENLTVYIVGRYTENFKIDKIITACLIKIPGKNDYEISIDDEFSVNNIDKKDALEMTNRILQNVFKRSKKGEL